MKFFEKKKNKKNKLPVNTIVYRVAFPCYVGIKITWTKTVWHIPPQLQIVTESKPKWSLRDFLLTLQQQNDEKVSYFLGDEMRSNENASDKITKRLIEFALYCFTGLHTW